MTTTLERDSQTQAEVLFSALRDSRLRWRELAAMSADFVFETDAGGHLTFVAPDPALGWSADELIGTQAERLLVEPAVPGRYNPFRPHDTVRRARCWLRMRDGRPACMQISSAPIAAAQGAAGGMRGIAQDVTDQEHAAAIVAEHLHRHELVDYVLARIRQEVLAPRMMRAALDALLQGIGAEGCAIVDMLAEDPAQGLMYSVGAGFDSLDTSAFALLLQSENAPQTCVLDDGRAVVVAPSQTHFGEEAGMLIWRAPNALPWTADELGLVASVRDVVRVILDHATIQGEMARQARTDALTGLLNRRSFWEEVERRLNRLEREGLPATLLYVDLDHFKQLNDRCGHDVGDDALRIVAGVLRATVRPSDLAARLGSDEFVLWLDGADDLTAAERAENLRTRVPDALAHLADASHLRITASIGIATRWPGRGEDLDLIMSRADAIMCQIKREARGQWRVSHAD